MNYTLVESLLLHIPSITLGFSTAIFMQRRQIPFVQVLRFAGPLGIAVGLFRLLPVPFGLHVPFLTLAMTLIVRFITGKNWWKALFGTLAVQFLGAVGEALVAFPALMRLGYTPADLLTDPFVLVKYGWIANIPILLLLLGIWVFRRNNREAARR